MSWGFIYCEMVNWFGHWKVIVGTSWVDLLAAAFFSGRWSCEHIWVYVWCVWWFMSHFVPTVWKIMEHGKIMIRASVICRTRACNAMHIYGYQWIDNGYGIHWIARTIVNQGCWSSICKWKARDCKRQCKNGSFWQAHTIGEKGLVEGKRG